MDRIDAMTVFIAALDEGSLVGAGRKLGRSPAAVSRAIAFLEAHVGAPLLHRTTRSIKTSEAGEHYARTCRRVLTDLEEAIIVAAGKQSAPCGTIKLSAPLFSGETVIRPILDDFLRAYPAVSPRLELTDKTANLIDEGIDVALRIAHLADSALVAIRVGAVRRVVVAAPSYLAEHPPIEEPGDLTRHQIIAYSPFGTDSWSFPPSPRCSVPRTVQLAPRFVVNTARAAVDSVIDGGGVTRVFSDQVADHVRDGALTVVLADHEHAPVPVHLISPPGRLSVPKIRAFVDFALPRLRRHYARRDLDMGGLKTTIRSPPARVPAALRRAELRVPAAS
jgi:DNA-binding transcriptional LysR family regulator